MAVVAALFMLFGVVDYIMLGVDGNFPVLIAMRIAVFTACMALVVSLYRRPSLIDNPLPVNLICLLLISSVLLVIPLRPETVESQLTAMVAVSVAIYLFIPNTIFWMLLLNLYLVTGFLLALALWSDIPTTSLLAAFMVLMLPNVIGWLTARRLNRLQREQFAALKAVQEANRHLQVEIKQRRQLESDLRRLAQTDDLTGLNNRRWFMELAAQELRRARRQKTPLSLCMLDLDFFKSINDREGHAMGDKILVLVADLCQRQLRESDIIGRFGGEEFIIALPDTALTGAREIGERLRACIENSQLPDELPAINLTVTIGISQIKTGEESLEPAILRADRALYHGKHQGRNRVVTEEQDTEDSDILSIRQN